MFIFGTEKIKIGAHIGQLLIMECSARCSNLSSAISLNFVGRVCIANVQSHYPWCSKPSKEAYKYFKKYLEEIKKYLFYLNTLLEVLQ